MENKNKALSINDLVYAYRSDWTSAKFSAIKGISLDVFEGESFGFLGHNGAGKTTTIKCILGLIRPSQGTISIFGRGNNDVEARRSVGYLPEQPYFYDYLTVQEIMEMYASLAGLDKSEQSKAIQGALDRVKVSARSKSPMRSLSKGLTQRVAMAQAIVADPKLLILDEPFSGLDPIGRKEFKDLLTWLRGRGTTIFMSSHILGDVESLCDRCSIMAQGDLRGVFDLKDIPKLAGGYYELVVNGKPGLMEKLQAFGASARAESGKFVLSYPERAAAERALSAVLLEGGEVDSYRFVQGNLEDLFVKLVQFEEAK